VPLSSTTPQEFAGSPDYVQSLDRGLAVVRAFDAEHAAMTLSEVAARARLSRAVARRLLLTLTYLGYVHQHGRQFSLTPRVLELGFSFLSSLTVAMLAQPVMEQVAHSIDESCSLAVLDAYDIVYVQRVPTQGYAYVEQELQEGLCSLAVPVRDGRGQTIAALNAGMPFRVEARTHALKKVLPALRNGARLIERSLIAGAGGISAAARA